MKWNEANIRHKLAHDDRWVCHALKILFDRQEADEREQGVAKRRNGMGFNSADAFFFGRLAEFYIANGFLTRNQLAAARKAGIGKYWKQVQQVIKANEKIKEERVKHETEKHLSESTGLREGRRETVGQDRVRQLPVDSGAGVVGGAGSEDCEPSR